MKQKSAAKKQVAKPGSGQSSAQSLAGVGAQPGKLGNLKNKGKGKS